MFAFKKATVLNLYMISRLCNRKETYTYNIIFFLYFLLYFTLDSRILNWVNLGQVIAFCPALITSFLYALQTLI